MRLVVVCMGGPPVLTETSRISVAIVATGFWTWMWLMILRYNFLF